MKLSLMTLGDIIEDPITKRLMPTAERYRAIIDASVIADEGGLYSVNLGEHHGLGYCISAPPVLLAAIAEKTKRLRLGTAVTLAANLDTYRIAEDYATVDVISNGRVEIVTGRGNFFEKTYDLFGHSLEESSARFKEAMELLCEIWPGEALHWQGTIRPPISGEILQPKPIQFASRPFWIGGGRALETAELAARLGMNLMLPSAFGEPKSFAPIVQHYRDAFAKAGHAHQPLVGGCWHVWVDRESQKAQSRFEPRYRAYHAFNTGTLIAVNRTVPDYLRAPFNYAALTTTGPAIVGSPAQVVDRLCEFHSVLGADVNLVMMDVGGAPRSEYLSALELLAKDVAPQVAHV